MRSKNVDLLFLSFHNYFVPPRNCLNDNKIKIKCFVLFQNFQNYYIQPSYYLIQRKIFKENRYLKFEFTSHLHELIKIVIILKSLLINSIWRNYKERNSEIWETRNQKEINENLYWPAIRIYYNTFP